VRAPLILVTGTGTGIGKTRVAEALVVAWQARHRHVAGLKPVESGVVDLASSDAALLQAASSFHVKQPGWAFVDPVSPHLAARRGGTALEPSLLLAFVDQVRHQVDALVVELPGGLFTPLAPNFLNCDFAARLQADATLLVAPDRLGVLHDAIAAIRAARAIELPITAILLNAPPIPDASSGTNATELRAFLAAPVVGPLPRASSSELAHHAALASILHSVGARA
jgi:dethiobiotin synthetase